MSGIQSQRIFWSDNGTLNDLSISLSEWRDSTETISYVAAEDYIYIGTELPFNHKHFEISTANGTTATASVELWDGNAWVAAVDELDLTSTSGASMAASGVLQFTPDREESWVQETDSFDVSGLTGTVIYSFYWARLSFSADITFALKYIGNKFADDNDLYGYYPDLNNTTLLSNFESGKTTWDDQHFAAADQIVRDLKKKSLIWSPNQLMDHQLFREAAVHKVAEIIYSSLGEAYLDLRNEARRYYQDAIEVKFFNLDQDRNGRLTARERKQRTGFMRR